MKKDWDVFISHASEDKEDFVRPLAREVSAIAVEAAEDYLREAQARVVEKTDPKRADIIRKMKPTF